MNEPRAVILVYSTSYAIRIDKVLRGVGISSQLIPVPRHLGSDCGVCVCIARKHKEAADVVLSAAHVDIVGMVDL